MPADPSNPEKWSGKNKLAGVIEWPGMNKSYRRIAVRKAYMPSKCAAGVRRLSPVRICIDL